jgi:hypothetical protein
MSFVDYGAGKGRVMLLASQYPFTQVGGIEFAEELHDNATMNIAQFPRSQMKCRNVECVLDDVVNITPVHGAAVHYFFNPFGPEIFAEVLKGIVASYHARPRRLYVILIDMEAAELCIRPVCSEVKLPPAERMQAQTLSPHDRRLPLARLSALLDAELLLQARRRRRTEDQLLVGWTYCEPLRHERRLGSLTG